MDGEYNCSVLLSEVLTAHLLIYSIFTVKALNKNMTYQLFSFKPLPSRF